MTRFEFDHDIMIMIRLCDRVFFMICEATYGVHMQKTQNSKLKFLMIRKLRAKFILA